MSLIVGNWILKSKLNVKCPLVQTLRLCAGRTAHRGNGGIVLLFLYHGTRRGRGVSVTLRPLLTPWKNPVPILQKAGWAPGRVWTAAENLTPTGIRSHSQSLYRLRYTAHILKSREWLFGINDTKLFFFLWKGRGGRRASKTERSLEGLRRRADIAQQWQNISRIGGSNLLEHKHKRAGWRIRWTDEEPFWELCMHFAGEPMWLVWCGDCVIGWRSGRQYFHLLSNASRPGLGPSHPPFQ